MGRRDLAAIGGTNLALTGRSGPVRLSCARVSSTFFCVLGVEPALGRAFTAAEDQPGQDSVVILRHALWAREFGTDPAYRWQNPRVQSDSPIKLVLLESHRNGFKSIFQGLVAFEPRVHHGKNRVLRQFRSHCQPCPNRPERAERGPRGSQWR
jgi:hypothetical protein